MTEATAPAIGSTYTKNGFIFRVNDIIGNEVYVTRWAEGVKEVGRDMHVPLDVWESEMKGAK